MGERREKREEKKEGTRRANCIEPSEVER